MLHNMHVITSITLSSYYVTPTPSVGLCLLAGHWNPCLAVSSSSRLDPPVYLVGESITSTQLVTGRGIILVPRFLLLAVGGAVCPVVTTPVAVQYNLIPDSPIRGFVTYFVVYHWCAFWNLISVLVLPKRTVLRLHFLYGGSHGLDLSLHSGGLVVAT